ncbi:hypothetical protein [Candidatus Cyanaurora vandensis]|uniref:hypothetical protein n=1 Tax=Candidatus Cyanaurora vandensis TaxID=2714958 RepID=UPI00257F86B9|nr:hypothetical protein [Candidatus Cyanaurora vandensis]
MYYVVTRTTFFKPEKKGGVRETRYLTIFDLWELEKEQARRFARYPTSTVKKLKAQGLEDVDVIEMDAVQIVEETAPTSDTVIIQTANLVLKVKPPERTNGTIKPTPTTPLPPAPLQPALRETALHQFNEPTAPTPEPWRGYIHLSRAAQGPERVQQLKCQDAVSFTYYYPSGQSLGQVFVCWYALKNESTMPSLEAFGEAWLVLGHMPDVVQFLSTTVAATLTPKDFCAQLEVLGFIDETNR